MEIAINPINQLIDLSKQHPELKIVPIVETEVVTDDNFYTWWASSFGDSYVDDIYFANDRYYIRSDDEEELMNDAIDNSGYDLLRTDEENEVWAKGVVNSYEWEKVILVRIEALKTTTV